MALQLTFTRLPKETAGTAADLRRGALRWPLQVRLIETPPVFRVTSPRSLPRCLMRRFFFTRPAQRRLKARASR